MEICGTANLDCVIKAEKTLQLVDLTRKLIKPKTKANSSGIYFEDDDLPDCNCLSMCTDLSYQVDISQSDWRFENDRKAFTRDGVINNTDE